MGIPFEKKYTQFSEDDIKLTTQTYHEWQQLDYVDNYKNIPEFCFSASVEEIEKRDFSLVPSKYIEFINRDENIDFDEKMTELQITFSELIKLEEASKMDLLKVFKELGYEIKL